MRWRCNTHGVTLDVQGPRRRLRGALGSTGRCALSNGWTEQRLTVAAKEPPRTVEGGKFALEQIEVQS